MGATTKLDKLKQIAGMRGAEQREAARQEYDAFVRAQQEKQQQRRGAANQGSQPAPGGRKEATNSEGPAVQGFPDGTRRQEGAGINMGPGYANRSFG